MFNNLNEMASVMVDYKNAIAVEAVCVTTGEVVFDIIKTDDFNVVYQIFPLDRYSVTTHGMIWARQMYIKILADEYHRLEEKSTEAEAKWESNIIMDYSRHYEMTADLAFEIAWRAGEDLAELLAKWTHRNIMTCRREIWNNQISYASIQED